MPHSFLASCRSSRSCTRAVIGSMSLSIAALLIAGSAFAQAVDIPAIAAAGAKGPKTAAVLNYGHQFKVNVDNAGQKITRDNAFLGLSHRIDVSEKTAVTLIGNYTLQQYNFSGGRNGGPGLPTDFFQWDDIHRGVIGAIASYEANDEWSILYGGLIRSWGEAGAEFGSTISGGLIGGFDYHPNEDFSIGLIIGALSALEDSVGLLPIPTLKWKFAEGWRLNVGLVRVADPGVGAEIDWQINDELSIGAGGAFQSRSFRLRDNDRAEHPNLPNRDDDGGIGKETQVPVYGLIRWKPAPKMAFDLQGGVSLANTLRVEDNGGRRISDDTYGNAPFIAAKATFAF